MKRAGFPIGNVISKQFVSNTILLITRERKEYEDVPCQAY